MPSYKVLTFLNLPNTGIRKNPGESVSTEELEAAGQTPENVQKLEASGVISSNPDAPINPAHNPVTITTVPEQSVVSSDSGEGNV